MTLENLINFLKKKGVRDTSQVFSKFENHNAVKHAFYSELRKFLYYNSLFRVMDELLEFGLLSIKTINAKKHYSLTEKGALVYEKLVEINDLLKERK
jgi:hypothetical protein